MERNNNNQVKQVQNVSLHSIGQTIKRNHIHTETDNTSNTIGLNPPGLLLTKREAECLYFLSRAMSTKKIAQILELSPRTVEVYINQLKIKMNITRKSALIEKAIELAYLQKTQTLDNF